MIDSGSTLKCRSTGNISLKRRMDRNGLRIILQISTGAWQITNLQKSNRLSLDPSNILQE